MEPASRCLASWLGVSLLALLPLQSRAQTCQTAADMDAAVRTAITNAGQRYFDMFESWNSERASFIRFE